MIMADKIIRLRKKNGWSQEELAEKMDVSRQAVSKWESAQTIPELEKILRLGELFDVTTDYLLKDDIEDEVCPAKSSASGLKRVSPEEANAYLQHRQWASWRIAIATFLCVLSPIPLLLLSGLSQNVSGVPIHLSEGLALGIGLIMLFLLVAVAVAMFISCGFRQAPYQYLDDATPFELAYGVSGMVKERQKAFRAKYAHYHIMATCLCILSPLPLLAGACLQQEWLVILLLCLTMIIAGLGACLFIFYGVRWASMQKLLGEGEYSIQEKKKGKVKETVGCIYWLLLTAVYLILSFMTDAWHLTWLVFAAGGVFFAALMAICNLILDKKLDKKP